jgi:peroxiredoxin
MLKVGDVAPPIDAVATDGKRFVLDDGESLCTVIYFFPKAFTPGCTTETKEFRKNYVELALAGARLVGVSTDSHDTQCRFASETGAAFPIIGDHDRRICKAYDVLWPLIGVAHRITYVVGPAASGKGMIVEAVFHHELDVHAHRDEVLRFVNDKFKASRPSPPAK